MSIGFRHGRKEKKKAERWWTIPEKFICQNCGEEKTWDDMEELFKNDWLCPKCGEKFFKEKQ